MSSEKGINHFKNRPGAKSVVHTGQKTTPVKIHSFFTTSVSVTTEAITSSA